MHHAWGIKNLSFALSCVDNQHQRQQGGLCTGVLCCLVSIWLSDILLDFISWLERSEFCLQSWQAEQTQLPRYFPVPAASCKEKGPCWALMDERALQQQWPAGPRIVQELSTVPHSSAGWHSAPLLLKRGVTQGEQALPPNARGVLVPFPLPWHPLGTALPKAPKHLKPGRSQKSQCGLGSCWKRYKGKYCHLNNDSFPLLQLFFYQYFDVFTYSHY